MYLKHNSHPCFNRLKISQSVYVLQLLTWGGFMPRLKLYRVRFWHMGLSGLIKDLAFFRSCLIEFVHYLEGKTIQ